MTRATSSLPKVRSRRRTTASWLQQRGVVFMACHNTIWEVAERLYDAERNPDHLGIHAIAAELTNHLVPDVVLTPGMVATVVKLQQFGFAYSR